ncbi:3-hydroxyacyl-CoA dehydrogenase NAD-binding domain-containing protein [Mesorhizobium sp. LNJC405B00]|uniref:3-hydroxyacyl-CoA dehydrogenase NAD-binding domain-containing protein n=1 Tax=unclassified Mesorhizobium TaxID=325217 RepID=UPI0003CF31CA|nr:3-hydroxyacyl-CoA dehydrogenase NAD-binding domain-containing protein [Mesorhizobium sp. LNJC405B00]ESY00244.1 3-hydroxyacyl-CoA dehydrogenase [Mesorhizobium sp. LNJC405B00]
MNTARFSESVTGKIVDGVLVVTIENPPANALSFHVRAGLMAALGRAASDEVSAVVLTAIGRTFIGGADIKEFGKPAIKPTLPEVIEAIESFAKPVVATVGGAALGGGCEIALACHYRVASKAASFGLPEVKLGLVPGAGGTQRLPRLIGTVAAIDLIGTGRPAKADEALTLGLIDAIADDLPEGALDVARRLVGQPLRRTGALSVPRSQPEAEAAAARMVLSRSRGQIAPAEAVRLVQAASMAKLEDGLADERATFLRLRDSREAAALRHVFFAERQASKVDRLEGVTPRKVETVGIVGTGLMGAGIAVSALNAGYRVIGIEQNDGAAAKGYERIAGLLDKSVQSGRLTDHARREALSRFEAASDAGRLVQADLVIEAVFDDLAVKTELFRKLERIVRPDAILATNTSYLNPDEIASATARPERIVGLHFFSPANVMRLTEVVDCAATAPDVLASAIAFVRKLGKLPVVCGVTEGFIGNRIYSAYRREAEFMVEDGAAPDEVDAALEAWGFPMGIFAVNDMAGLEIAWARRKRQAAMRDPQARYVEIADRLCEAGRFGRKTGRGWYDYSDGERRSDPQVAALIEAVRAAKDIVPRRFSPDEIVTRLLAAMAEEGKALLAEGIAARASDIDLVMINGYGFPAHKGGPMFHAGDI